MDVSSDFVSLLYMCYDWLKSTYITSFGITFSFFDILIGGIVLFLVFYFIFRIGE